MNTFALSIVWCIVQVTLLATVALGWYALLRRSGPAARSLAASTGLALTVALTALSFSPWPAWSIAAWGPSDGERRIERVEQDLSPNSSDPREANPDSASDMPRNASTTGSTSLGELFARSLMQELEAPVRGRAETGWSWPAVLSVLVAGGAVIGLVRLVAGLVLVRTYRARSRSIVDAALLELRDVVQAELACRRSIELVESNLLSTAATIGWHRPLIILPTNWREWTDDERRAVLAHEIAHIARHDFPTWVAAQVALVLHFYHPLVHWLAGRLRLEQELAADAAAARLAGGQQTYLTTLAAMALRQPDRPLAWPARTFLPTRGTFMRRIEMLRDAKLGSTTTSAGVRAGTVGVLAAAGLLIAGLRGGSVAGDAAPGNPAATLVAAAAVGADEPAALRYVPRDAVFVATLRPARLISRPQAASVAKMLQQQGALKQELGIGVDHLEQVTVVFLAKEIQPGRTGPELAGVIVKATQPGDLAAFLKSEMPESREKDFAGVKYLMNTKGTTCWFGIDPQSGIFSRDEANLRRMIVAGTTGAARTRWAAAWSEVAGDDGALLVNVETIRSSLDAELMQGANHGVALLASFAPLWKGVDVISLALKLDERLAFRGRLYCPTVDDAKKARETIAAAATLAKNSLSPARAAAARSPANESALMLGAFDIIDAALEDAKFTQQDKLVEIALAIPGNDAATMLSALVPAVGNARSAARQSVSMNNLKQIGLAMHNYHDLHGSFPPAVLYGPDGRTPYSWRVAILPYLDQDALFRQYNFNEPWDSAGNKRVLAQMPPAFRDPGDEATSTNASYFVLTGPDTLFPGREGMTMPRILDGTSNTLLAVEAQRDIPWTKPEDIPYDAAKPLQKFGGHFAGGFLVLMGDGAVRLLKDGLNEATLRAFITRQGGEVIPPF